MSSNVHSARWYRVASLQPALGQPLQLRRQRVRGDTWFLLGQPAGGRSLRLNAAAWGLAARLDGHTSLQRLWEQALAHSDDPPSQDELIELLAQLHEAGLLLLRQPADAALLQPSLTQPAPATHPDTMTPPHRRAATSPGGHLLAWRLPLGNPNAWLERLAPLARLLFSGPAALVWLLAVAALGVQALLHAPELLAQGRLWLASPGHAGLAALLWLPIKLLHELAHGLALCRWGAPVRQAGVTLMLGLPMPWVDASAAAGLPQRHQRVLVGAAGMAAELALAAAALPLWLALPDGPARDAAFATLAITGVSTLLFNANPLQRLDGYHIACDLLGLPNLATRSRQWWLHTLQRWLLPRGLAEPLATARGERPWLATYAPMAWLCSLLLAALAAVWLASLSWQLGLAAALLLGWQLGLRPAWGLWRALKRSLATQAGSAGRARRLVSAGAGALLLLGALPWPQHHLLQGVVWPPEQAQLRAEEDGFVQALPVRDGQAVAAGTVVAELVNPALSTRLQRQEARVAALEAELLGALPRAEARDAGPERGHPAQGIAERNAGDAQAELSQAEHELAHLRQRVAALAVRAQVAGRVAWPQAADLPGQYLRRGQLIGQVLPAGAIAAGSASAEPASQGFATTTVRLALPESEALALRSQASTLSVRLASAPGQAHAARLMGASGGAVMQLPSAALSQRRGGPVPTDPQDSDDLKPLRPVLQLDVQVDLQVNALASSPADRQADQHADLQDAAPGAPAPVARQGERAWVRFESGWAPLAWQALQRLRPWVLAQANPQF